MKKNTVPKPSTYRFDQATQDLMDRLAEHFYRTEGMPHSRADVIRKALHKLGLEIPDEKLEKKKNTT